MKKAKPNKRIDSGTREEIKIAYLSGISIDEIIKKFNITKTQFEKLRTRFKWKSISKEIEQRTEELVIEQLAHTRAKVLNQMHQDSLIIISNCMKRLKDESEYDDIPVYNSEGEVVGHKKVYQEINALIRGWSLAYSKLLRSIGEPEVIREKPDNGNTKQPIIQILMDTGLRPEFKEKIINASLAKQ
ncbi:MAG: hypothetical protein GW938_07680 [Leptospira sp.]|nr:hypothetical protein [Leptospira sp.]